MMNFARAFSRVMQTQLGPLLAHSGARAGRVTCRRAGPDTPSDRQGRQGLLLGVT